MTRQPATPAAPRTVHVCPECRHWHDPDAPLVAPAAAAGSGSLDVLDRIEAAVRERWNERHGHLTLAGFLAVMNEARAALAAGLPDE